MDDRELLELAAKAAGEVQGGWIGNAAYLDGVLSRWNPLTDDGDALRLAVELRLAIDIGVVSTSINGPQEGQQDFVVESHNDAPYAATRRAIVRAAAALAKDAEAR